MMLLSQRNLVAVAVRPCRAGQVPTMVAAAVAVAVRPCWARQAPTMAVAVAVAVAGQQAPREPRELVPAAPHSQSRRRRLSPRLGLGQRCLSGARLMTILSRRVAA